MHGFEREGIRISPDGLLSQALHPESLGSSLTHPYITTDFTEPQLELRTSPSDDLQVALHWLSQIHLYTAQALGDELVWPFSMPPRLPDGEEQIPLAVYGTSSLGEKKTLYRRGIGFRYGRRRLTLSGVHHNISIDPAVVGRELLDLPGDDNFGSLSECYFHIIRNLNRRIFYFTYLFGASPAFDKSFRAEGTSRFKQHKASTLYSEFATSLRGSDIGYNSEVQDALRIRYDSLDAFIEDLARAVNTCNPDYLAFSGRDSNQLNANYLQAEEELYAPFRPRQQLNSGEGLLDALRRRGLGYIEIRLLDIDPEHPSGIDPYAVGFLHMAMLDCLRHPSPGLGERELTELGRAHQEVIWRGREKGLQVVVDGEQSSFHDLGRRYCEELYPLAEKLDQKGGSGFYQESLRRQIEKWNAPELTPSGKILTQLLDGDKEFVELGIDIAEENGRRLAATDADADIQEEIEVETQRSRQVQLDLETEEGTLAI